MQLKAYVEAWEKRERREDRRAARVCAMVANAAGGRGRGKKPFSEEDFMPRPARQEIHPEALLAKFQAYAAAHNKAEGVTADGG